MTVIESIVRDLNGMPMRKLVEVARYVHRLSETVERERAEVLRETHGYLSDEDRPELRTGLGRLPTTPGPPWH